MPTPINHAVCSASSSERWLHCTAAPRFEEQFPERSSEYAEEGRLAHSLCELFGRKKLLGMPQKEYLTELGKITADPRYKEEMAKTAEFYTDYLAEKAMSFPEKPYVAFEIKVDFSDIVPEGFGTCDSVMIGNGVLRIHDYKHGKGIAVSSKDNSQMMLYALGALRYFGAVFGDSIQRVIMAIIQPRITEDVTETTMTVEELRAWGESVRPKAQSAYTGIGAAFEPGDWCRFCRGKSICTARAAKFSAFEDFKDCVPAGKAEKTSGAPPTETLSDAEVGDLLTRAKGLVDWYNDLRDYALQTILAGGEIPGYKVVAGKSNRAFTDDEQAINAFLAAGYTEESLYDRKPKTLAALEKMAGKKPFEKLVGGLVTRPVGKPTLVEASDPREAFSPAASDFSGVGGDMI